MHIRILITLFIGMSYFFYWTYNTRNNFFGKNDDIKRIAKASFYPDKMSTGKNFTFVKVGPDDKIILEKVEFAQ